MDAQGHALELAEQAAEALRELNHRTRDPRAFTGPAELDRLVGELAILVAGWLPQLRDQLYRWLRAEHDVGRVRADTGTDPGRMTPRAPSWLTPATPRTTWPTSWPPPLQHLAHLGATQPDRAPNQGGPFNRGRDPNF